MIPTPPRRVRLGEHRVDTWRLTAIVGLVAATAWLVCLAAATGGSPWVALALVPLLLVGQIASLLGRRWATGRETNVLLEQLLLALAVTAGVTWIAGLDPVRWLDRLVPSLAVLFAWGRIGCTAAGCCHGVPSNVGLGPTDRRRFPTQPLEAAAWAVLAVLGTGVAWHGERGLAAASVLIAYAVIRFVLEGVRGDRRPHLAGLSESRWLSLVALAIGLGLAGLPSGPAAGFTAAGALAAVALWGTRHHWLLPPSSAVLATGAQDWVRSTWSDLPADGSVRSVRLGEVSLAASRQGTERVVTVAAAGADPLERSEALAVLEEVATALDRALPEVDEPRPGLFLAVFSDPVVATPDPPERRVRPADYFG